MKKLKAISIFVLCFALLFSSTITASAAQSAKAATLRLEKTQGTVTVTNASGTNKKATQNMKLLSGYTVSTGKASYAYISLDSSKALKLDASSKVSIHKAGKKLEVKVVSGKVMFNVSAPLTSQESLTIRTSTMVTGVRGTAGWFESDQTSSAVYLLEGSLDVYSTGRSKPINITSGQQMTSQAAAAPGTSDTPTTPDGSGSPGETEVPAEVKVESFSTEEVPGFVAAAVAEDTSLQSRMQDKGSPIDAAAVASVAEEKLKQDETAAAKQEQQIQQQEKESTAEAQKNQENSNNTLFEDNKPAAPSAPPSKPKPKPTPAPTPTRTQITLENPTQELLEDSLAYYDDVYVSFGETVPTDEGLEATPDFSFINTFAGLTIPRNKILYLTAGTMTVVSERNTIDENGETISETDLRFSIEGTFIIEKDAALCSQSTDTIVAPTGELKVDGRFYHEFADEGKEDSFGIFNRGKMTVNGEIKVASPVFNEVDIGTEEEPIDSIVIPKLEITPSGTLFVTNSVSAITNISGQVIVNGIVDVSIVSTDEQPVEIEGGTFINSEGDFAELTFGSNANIKYPVGFNALHCNHGKVTIAKDADITLCGNIWNTAGEIHIYGSLTFGSNDNVADNSVRFENNGGYVTVYQSGKFINNAEFINSGEFSNNSNTVTNNGRFENRSVLSNSGTINNTSEFFNSVVDENEKPLGVGYLKNYATINNKGKFFNNAVIGDTDSEHYYKIENFGTINNARIGENNDTVIFENHSTLINTDGGIIDNEATLRNNTGGELKNEGTINNNDRFENRSTLINVNKGIIDNFGEFMNSVVDDKMQLGVGYIDNYATINNYGKFFNITVFNDTDSEHYYKIKNSGIINNIRNNEEGTETGIFENDSTLINTANGTINNSGFFGNGNNEMNTGNIENYGTINTSNEFKNLSTLKSNGVIKNSASFNNSMTGSIENNKTFENRGTLANVGTIINKDLIVNSIVDNQNNIFANGTIENSGTITNYGFIDNVGDADNLGKFSNDGTGTLINVVIDDDHFGKVNGIVYGNEPVRKTLEELEKTEEPEDPDNPDTPTEQ